MGNLGTVQQVFSKVEYIGIAIGVSCLFFVVFNALDEFLFFSPFVVFEVPAESYPNFAVSTIIVGLLGVVISMNVYMFKILGVKLKDSTSWMSGSFIATASGACGCSALGFSIISTFGGAGILASSFLTNYQLPLKLASLVVLIFAFYSVRKNMIKSCSTRKN